MRIKRYRQQDQSAYYRLENDNGVTVQIGAMGAAVQRIELPDGRGGRVNVCLGFENEADYAGNTLYSGATIAPVAGRISGRRFAIGNRIYPLCPGEPGSVCLHGGRINASFMEWMVMQSVARDGAARLGLCAVLPEDLEGFPGNRVFSATYTLDNENCLTVDYDAVSDRDTYVAMTNHTYFNLSGDFSSSGLAQRLYVNASSYVSTDEHNLPLELKSVDGTPFDYREPVAIAEKLAQYPEDEQTERAKGLDHAFDVREAAGDGRMLAELSDPVSGRRVRIFSRTGQAVTVYTGGAVGDKYVLDGGVSSSDGCAVAMECEAFPNAVNMPEFEPQILCAGKNYHHQIRYEFSY